VSLLAGDSPNAHAALDFPRGRCGDGRLCAARAQAEDALSAALGRLFAVAENYPDLKASANFLALQQQLSALEDELQMARRYYNGAVRNLNVLVQSFPSNLIAGLFDFGPREYFELSDAGEGAVPRVDLAPAPR
jgi:LemA protein